MNRTTHHRISLLALTGLGLGAILVPSADAHAASAAVMQLAKGVGGKEVTGEPKKNAGAGTEQSVATAVTMNGKQYVVTVYMSSDVEGNDRPTELKCSSVELDPINGPKLVANQVQLTKAGNNDNGNREGNHPALATDGTNILFAYGSDANNTNVQTMAGVLDAMCNVVSKPIVVSRDNNQNSGAADVKYFGNGFFLLGYLEGGNNVREVGLQLQGTTLKKNFDNNVINPANVGRPTIAVAGPDRALFCAAKGDNRPPEVGITCGFVNAVTGDILVKQTTIAASNPDAKVYMNQPTVAPLGNGLFAVNYQKSNGAGKNDNKKGANVQNLMVIKANDAGFETIAEGKEFTSNATHSSLCTTEYGTDGKTMIGVMSASISGVGVPTIQMVAFDPATKTLKADPKELWSVGYAADSGLISNIYGQNPTTQGRDFLTCTGNVKNPGFGVKGGYQSNVETFMLAPHSGRNPGEPKNALFLSFVPAKVAAPVPHSEPTALDPTGNNSTPEPPPATKENPPPAAADPTDKADPGPDPKQEPTDIDIPQPAGCACSTPGSTNSSGEAPLAIVAALGLAVAMISRRKES